MKRGKEEKAREKGIREREKDYFKGSNSFTLEIESET